MIIWTVAMIDITKPFSNYKCYQGTVKVIEMKTGLEHLERLEQLARKIAENYSADVRVERDLASAIVAEIDGPKTDEDWARKLAGEPMLDGWFSFALNCIAKGRELERAMYVECGSVGYSKGSYPTYKRIDEASAVEPR